MSALSVDIVKKIAKLSRIKTTPQENLNFAQDLSSILHEIEMLQELSIDHIEPVSNLTEETTFMRKDAVMDGDIVTKILSNTKNVSFNYFTVPKVIE